MKGYLISFEGTDGCGKSTQIKLLKEHLENSGYTVTVSREPGGSKVGEKIREILLSKENTEISPMCELFLYEAARAQHAAEIIEPALERGEIVILDRFTDSTFAYQGFGRNLGEKCVETLNSYAVGDNIPDLTLMLKLPPEAAFVRKGGNDKSDRMEMAGDDFFKRVEKGFERAAEKFSDRIKIINVAGTKAKTHKKICDCVDKMLGENK